jgi:ribonuclease G
VPALVEWLYEVGIGENRAILVDEGAIIEAQIELPGVRAGTVADARLTSILVPGRRGIATLGCGTELLLEPLPKITEGAVIRVEIVREAIPEAGAVKRAKGRVTDAELGVGPDLATRIGAHRIVGPHDVDDFEQAGWSECLEAAATGVCAFAEGSLRIAQTPAMVLIDVDGPAALMPLALAGARAAAQTIRRFGLTGNIGIDLPTVSGKAERAAIAAAFDAALPLPYERTAVNGFGFLQVIRPRVRASLSEIILYDSVAAQARALIRQIQRSRSIGATELIVPASMSEVIAKNPHWIGALSSHLGGMVRVKSGY